MDSRHPQKSLHQGGRLAFLKPNAAGRDPRHENRDVTQSSASAQAAIVQDGDAGFAGTVPVGLSNKLASELFARLLLELPEHRRDLQSAYRDRNNDQLEGPLTNCSAPWSTAISRNWPATLRELKQTIKSVDAGLTGPAFARTIRLIDDLLACSGYHAR